MEIDDELIYGGAYQYHVSPRLAVEGSFFFSPASLEVEDMVGIDNDDDEDGVDDDENNGDDGDADNGEDDDDDDVGVSASYVTGSLVYYFREAGRILPFVMAGGGVADARHRRGGHADEGHGRLRRRRAIRGDGEMAVACRREKPRLLGGRCDPASGRQRDGHRPLADRRRGVAILRPGPRSRWLVTQTTQRRTIPA